MKLYTQHTCHYCKKVKDALDSNDITYDEIIIAEKQDEWNELVRITGVGITPTIVMQEEVWVPNRDFRNPEELVTRIKHFVQNPMAPLRFEERLDQINNNVKNLTLILNQMQQVLQQISSNVAGTPNINTKPGQPQVPEAQTQQAQTQQAPIHHASVPNPQ